MNRLQAPYVTSDSTPVPTVATYQNAGANCFLVLHVKCGIDVHDVYVLHDVHDVNVFCDVRY